MCGISITIGPSESCLQDLEFTERMEHLLSNRGPDCLGRYKARVSGGNWNLNAFGSTLWTQGSRPCEQPLTTERGSFLLWNGDAYNLNASLPDQSDSHFILKKIEETRDPLIALRDVCGPYAFIYYEPNTRCVWFGRDPIGRCSLILGQLENEKVVTISSVLPYTVKSAEISSQGIYQLSLSSSSYEFTFYPWYDTLCNGIPEFPTTTSVSEATAHNVLRRCNFGTNTLPTDEEVYSNSSSMDLKSNPLTILKLIASRPKVASEVDELTKLLQASVEVRAAVKPKLCKDCPADRGQCSHSKVGILFSGGLDSTILAAMAHKALDPSESIDLYNVAFDKSSMGVSNVPDRLTGYVALKELENMAPNRTWNFIKIDIDESELSGKLNHIADLVHPLNTVLDESLGCALWFAARGEGVVDSAVFKSSARVVLVGMGADELFGGYSRHAKQLNKSGSWADLGALLAKEVLNIGSRNLGRDNRVISDHGRMMRAPFLDEKFVSYVSALAPWVRCCPNSHLPRGVGDKTLLRLVALRLGLEDTAVQPKRALQFGTRIANPKQKGHEVSSRLINTS